MDKTTYYEITQNTDQTEGRGGSVTTGIFFWKKPDALEFVKSYRYQPFGVMGTTGSQYDIRERTTKLPRIYESLEEYDKAHPSKEKLAKVKREALAKLSDVERRALGLEE
jgi:hypothetical protein